MVVTMHFTSGHHSIDIAVPQGARGVVARVARINLPMPGMPLIDCAIRFDTGDGANFTVMGGETFSTKTGLRNQFSGYALDLPTVAGPDGLPVPALVESATLSMMFHADVEANITFEVY